MLNRFFSNTLYVQIRKNAFRVRNIENKVEREISAPKPFTTTRLLIGQFQEADALLRKVVRDIGRRRLLQLSPTILIHPTEMVEGGLSEIEERTFLELGRGVGARKVVIHVGAPLTDGEVETAVYGK